MFLFGCEHLSVRPEVGDFVLLRSPAALVLETAVTEEQGRVCGSCVGDSELAASREPWHATVLNVSAHLQAQLGETDDPLAAPLWQQVRLGAAAEQAALVAALVRRVPVLFGDRPKDATVRRLLAESAAELDAAFGAQLASNWGMPPAAADAPPDAFARVVLSERDAVLYNSLRRAAAAAGPGAAVVGLVGGAHLDALATLFEAAPRFLDEVDHLLQAPPPPAEGLGLRAALAEALLRTRCPEEVAAEAAAAAGSLPAAERAAYEAASELYGSARMLLATLPRERLPEVVCARGGGELWELLRPLREARPSNGGAGWSEEALAVARAGMAVPGLAAFMA